MKNLISLQNVLQKILILSLSGQLAILLCLVFEHYVLRRFQLFILLLYLAKHNFSELSHSHAFTELQLKLSLVLASHNYGDRVHLILVQLRDSTDLLVV